MNANAVPRSAVRFVVPILVAAVPGPLIAGIAVWLFVVASDLFDPASSLAGEGGLLSVLAGEGGLLFVFVGFAYLIGGPIALLAGVLLSLWMIWRPPSAVAANAAAVIATVIWLGTAEGGFPSLVEEAQGRGSLLFTLALAVFAANVCWFSLRRFVRLASAPSAQPNA